MIFMTALAKNLAIAMSKSEKYGTQEKLAAALKISQAAIQKVTSGDTKQPRYILKMAKLLNVDPGWLTGDAQADKDVSTPKNNKLSHIGRQAIQESKPTYNSKDAGASLTDEELEIIDLVRKLSKTERASFRAGLHLVNKSK